MRKPISISIDEELLGIMQKKNESVSEQINNALKDYLREEPELPEEAELKQIVTKSRDLAGRLTLYFNKLYPDNPIGNKSKNKS